MKVIPRFAPPQYVLKCIILKPCNWGWCRANFVVQQVQHPQRCYALNLILRIGPRSFWGFPGSIRRGSVPYHAVNNWGKSQGIYCVYCCRAECNSKCIPRYKRHSPLCKCIQWRRPPFLERVVVPPTNVWLAPFASHVSIRLPQPEHARELRAHNTGTPTTARRLRHSSRMVYFRQFSCLPPRPFWGVTSAAKQMA